MISDFQKYQRAEEHTYSEWLDLARLREATVQEYVFPPVPDDIAFATWEQNLKDKHRQANRHA